MPGHSCNDGERTSSGEARIRDRYFVDARSTECTKATSQGKFKVEHLSGVPLARTFNLAVRWLRQGGGAFTLRDHGAPLSESLMLMIQRVPWPRLQLHHPVWL